MRERNFRYKELLENRRENERRIENNFFSEQSKIAKEFVKKNLQFGKQVIVKDPHYPDMMVLEIDLSKIEEDYVVEHYEYHSGWERFNPKKYVETFILSSKYETLNSLPICLQVVFYPELFQYENDKVVFNSIGLFYPGKIEVYAYVFDSTNTRFSYSGKHPIMIENDVKPNKDTLTLYIDSKDKMDCSLAIENKELINGFERIESLKKDNNSVDLTFENLLDYLLKKKVIEEFELFYSINTYETHCSAFNLMEDLVTGTIVTVRRKIASDVEFVSDERNISGKIKNLDIEAFFVTVIAKIEGTDCQKMYKYYATNIDSKLNFKQLFLDLS